MSDTNKQKTALHVIDFSSNLTEGYIKTFAYKVEEILKSMITGNHSPVSVKGEEQKVKAFARAIGNEERYILALRDSKEDDPKTMAFRHELENSIADFEKTTGIKWPVR